MIDRRIPAARNVKAKSVVTYKSTLAAMVLLMASEMAFAESLPFYRDVHGNILPNGVTAEMGGFPIPFIRFNKPELTELGNAYRVYAFIKYCHEIHRGYLVVYVNDIELDRAREKIKAIEAPFIAAQPDLDTKEVFDGAAKSLSDQVGLSRFMSVDGQTCHMALRQLLDSWKTPTGNMTIEKDF